MSSAADGIEKARAGHDRVSLRLAGRQRRAERHIGGALFVARMHRAQPVGKLEQRLEQQIVLHAGKRIDGVEAVGDERGDHRLRRGHRCHCRSSFFRFFPLHHRFPPAVTVQIGADLSRAAAA